MYVCVCNAVTERDIGTAVASGCGNLRELRERLGVGAGCGRCSACARETLRRVMPEPAVPESSSSRAPSRALVFPRHPNTSPLSAAA